jgi:hypothetical protein
MIEEISQSHNLQNLRFNKRSVKLFLKAMSAIDGRNGLTDFILKKIISITLKLIWM